jgi:spermidine/putrescine transport system permease protein
MAAIRKSDPSLADVRNTIRNRDRLRLFGLLLPGTFWIITFFLLPLAIIVLYSFLRRSPTGDIEWTFGIENYVRLFSNPLYLGVFWRSFSYAILTTIICLLIGYPLAYFITRQNARWRAALIFAIMIPFWTNFLVRIYAWRILLNNTGVVNTIVEGFGFERLPLINTPTAVMIGLIYGELPFMVLPLYAALERFDWTLLEAAQDLYASRVRAFWRVLLPLTLPGITAGSVLVFVPTVGQFVVPQLLGGNKVAMLGNILEEQFQSAQNIPFGSAIALVFMAILMLAILLYFRATTEERR